MYKLKVRTGFTDKYDETKKYVANEIIEVSEERALELLSSETPVVRYVSRKENETIETLKVENAKLEKDKESLEETIETLKVEIKDLKSKKKDNKETVTDKTE